MKKILYTFVLLGFSLIVHSQSIEPSVLASTGNFSSNANFSLSSTVGELMIETFTGTNNIISQGFHQPTGVQTSIHYIEEAGTSITVYPIPANNILNVEILSDQYDEFVVEIWDLLGKKTDVVPISNENMSVQFVSGTSTLDISKLASGIYMLRIMSDNNEFQKVIKINKQL